MYKAFVNEPGYHLNKLITYKHSASSGSTNSPHSARFTCSLLVQCSATCHLPLVTIILLFKFIRKQSWIANCELRTANGFYILHELNDDQNKTKEGKWTMRRINLTNNSPTTTVHRRPKSPVLQPQIHFIKYYSNPNPKKKSEEVSNRCAFNRIPIAGFTREYKQ